MARREVEVLLIEKDAEDEQRLREMLAESHAAHFQWTHTPSLHDAMRQMTERRFDVAVVDVSPPDGKGLNGFAGILRRAGDLPVIMISDVDDEALVYEAMQKGAQDYLVKANLNSAVLERSIRYAIERVRRRVAERELHRRDEQSRMAREMQQKLFPDAPPNVPGYDIAGASYPAEATGGDYYDHITMPDGTLAIVVADVSSHGFGPALVMAETRAYLRALMLTRTDIEQILNVANRALAHDTNDDCFVTLVLARLDPAARQISYASAGHPTAYVMNSAGQIKHELKSTGIPLGIEPAHAFRALGPIVLSPGDLVLLLTDGVLEAAAPDRSRFGIERTLQTVRENRDKPATQIVDALYHAVREFGQQQTHVDDITAVVIKAE